MAVPGPLSGHTLGEKYLLGALIGQGGFGVVYQAQHTLLGRPQAIKILLEQHFTNPKFRERFLREARTLATLDHGNILPVHDFGIEQDRAYLVMPYIAGGTLESMLRGSQRPMGLGAIWRCLEQICLALDYAHTRNVAHLDLKPGNLLVHEDGRLLLSDFGLAHLMEQGAVEGSTSLQFGTPAYMAPEHLQGHPERRSDVYAVGVIVYQMLTGRMPFEGSTPAIIMVKQLNEPPPPLRAARPDLPPSLEDVLNKALAKDPNLRYQTAGALLADFKAAVGGATGPTSSGFISDPNTPTRIAQLYSDPTLRAGQPPAATVPAELYQELAELKEAVRKLAQAPALQAGALPAGPSGKRKQKEPASTATQPPAGLAPAPQKSGVSTLAILSLILALLALAAAASFISGAIVTLTHLTGSYYDSCYNYDYNNNGCIGGYETYDNTGLFWGLMAGGLSACVLGIPAIILGRRARRRIRRSNGRLTGLRAAESGVVLAWIVPGDWVAMLLWLFLKLLWKLLKLLGTFFHLIARLFFRDDDRSP